MCVRFSAYLEFEYESSSDISKHSVEIGKSKFETQIIHPVLFNVAITTLFTPSSQKISFFVNNQLDAQVFFLYLFIPILYMFRTTKCSSSGE